MAEGPSLQHNRELSAAYIAASKVYSRFPKVSEQAPLSPIDTIGLPPYAYNPSILSVAGKLITTYRYHFAGDFRTRLGWCTHESAPKDIPLEGCSQEDARLFRFQGETWMSWTEADVTKPPYFKCVVRYGQFENGTISRIFQPKCGGNTGRDMEKNWCFFDHNENLFAIYKSHPEQAVLQIQGETVVNEYKTEAVYWPYGEIRGGSIVEFDGKLLRFFHSKTERGIGCFEHRYYVGAALMDSKPPFKTLVVSKRPILYGSEIDHLKQADRKACFHFKPRVVFPCGAMAHEGGWILSCGINDFAGALVKITEKDLNL